MTAAIEWSLEVDKNFEDVLRTLNKHPGLLIIFTFSFYHFSFWMPLCTHR